jgi:hypothetical protein
VCSLASLGVDTTVDEVARRVALAAGEVLGATLEEVALSALDLPPGAETPARPTAPTEVPT